MQSTKLALFALAITVLSNALTFPGHAHAEPTWIVDTPSDERRLTDLSVGAGISGARGFAATTGMLLGIPVVDGGFITRVNDSFFLEPALLVGVRRRHGDESLWVIPEFGPRWNFYLTPNWDAFASLKLGWAIGHHGDVWVRGSVGMMWWFSRPFALRLESNAGRVGPGVFAGLSYAFL